MNAPDQREPLRGAPATSGGDGDIALLCAGEDQAVATGYRLGREGRLERLPIGTVVLLSSGKMGTLVACTFTRAVVRLATGAKFDVAPAAELEVLELVGDDAAAVSTPLAERSETPACGLLARQGMRHAVPAQPSGRPAGRDASGQPCATCGANFSPRRPWQRHCTGRCRQRAYRRARLGSRTDPTTGCVTPAGDLADNGGRVVEAGSTEAAFRFYRATSTRGDP